MQPRMKSPILTMPGTLEATQQIAKAAEASGVPRATLELVQMRVGQINGCAVCVDMHARVLKKSGEKDARIFSVAVWRETPYYSEQERAALALAEAATRLSDRSNAVPDDVWKESASKFSDKELGAIVMTIALANFWNRLNVATGQLTGDWVEQYLPS